MCNAKELGNLNKGGMRAFQNGDLMNAEFLLHQALRRAEALGVEGFTAKIRNNLGLVLSSQGKNEAAAQLFTAALETIEKRVGRDNKVYKAICNNLATVMPDTTVCTM